MVKVIVTGAGGRMGRAVIGLLAHSPDCRLAGACEVPGHPDIGRDMGGVTVADRLENVIGCGEVVIDFTTPAVTLANVDLAVKNRKNIVIGTTGIDAAGQERIRTAGRTIGVVMSGNMSVGVNLLAELVGQAARVLGDEYDVEVIEAHHHFKKDAPSGTALMLARAAAAALGRDLAQVARHGREGQVGERPAREIGLHAVRGGDIVGDHTVLFAGTGERIELVHRAGSRDLFAQGALRAAAFLAGKKNGFFDMRDVLGFKG
jgi:4-hydroxy-tetrahydrodipicolinate reductase